MDGVLIDKSAPAEAASSAAQPSFDTAGASFDTTMEDEPKPNKVVGTLDLLAGHEIAHTERLACSFLFAVTNKSIVLDLPKLDLESYISNYAGK